MNTLSEIEKRKRLGDYLRRLRGKESQDDLAARARLTGSGLSLLENGDRDPKLSTIVRLATALKISETKLIAVYKGKDPEETPDDSPQVVQDIIDVLIRRLPHRVLLDALIQHDGADKVREVLKSVKGNHEF
jgi:transcriptional regulator with XRE-family HTH domain